MMCAACLQAQAQEPDDLCLDCRAKVVICPPYGVGFVNHEGEAARKAHNQRFAETARRSWQRRKMRGLV